MCFIHWSCSNNCTGLSIRWGIIQKLYIHDNCLHQSWGNSQTCRYIQITCSELLLVFDCSEYNSHNTSQFKDILLPFDWISFSFITFIMFTITVIHFCIPVGQMTHIPMGETHSLNCIPHNGQLYHVIIKTKHPIRIMLNSPWEVVWNGSIVNSLSLSDADMRQ